MPGETAWSHVFLILATCCQARAAIHQYDGQLFYQALNKWGSWGYVAPGINNGQSEVNLHKLEFHRSASAAQAFEPDEHYTGLIQAVLFEVNDRDKIGYPTPQGYRYCCTKELVSKTACHIDRLIVKEGRDSWPRVIDIHFEHNSTVATPAAAVDDSRAVTLQSTGMYYLWFVSCEDALSAATVHGQTVWKNPTGYLPGMMLPHIRFFLGAWLLYSALTVPWLGAYLRHYGDLLVLQHCITAAVIMGWLEMGAWHLDYTNFNHTGRRPLLVTLVAALLSSVRATLVRVLILITSMGYGVVMPYLGAMQKKILALACLYLLSLTALTVITNVGTVDDVTSTARIFLTMPVGILDALLVVWVFMALSRTLNQLQLRGAAHKLVLMKHFTNTLAVWVWVSVAWLGYELFVKISDQYDEHWQRAWILVDFWHLTNLAFLCVICWLWRPSPNAPSYAYNPLDDDELDQGEGATKGRPANGDREHHVTIPNQFEDMPDKRE
eukprot:jgi/Astpho2/521/Aster-03556